MSQLASAEAKQWALLSRFWRGLKQRGALAGPVTQARKISSFPGTFEEAASSEGN
jgi:hypothetical protein